MNCGRNESNELWAHNEVVDASIRQARGAHVGCAGSLDETAPQARREFVGVDVAGAVRTEVARDACAAVVAFHRQATIFDSSQCNSIQRN